MSAALKCFNLSMTTKCALRSSKFIPLPFFTNVSTDALKRSNLYLILKIAFKNVKKNWMNILILRKAGY